MQDTVRHCTDHDAKPKTTDTEKQNKMNWGGHMFTQFNNTDPQVTKDILTEDFYEKAVKHKEYYIVV